MLFTKKRRGQMARYPDMDRWCVRAARKIKYGPDRKQVEEELYAHLEDRYMDLMAEGFAPEEAQKEAVRRMGDADAVALEMGRIHKPFLAYSLNLLRTAIVIGVAAILCMIPWTIENLGIVKAEELMGYEPFALIKEDGGVRSYQYLQVLEPDYKVSSKYSEVRLKKFVQRQIIYEGGTSGDCHFLIEIENAFPWMAEPELIWNVGAVDSQGEKYYSQNESIYVEPLYEGELDKTVNTYFETSNRTGLSTYNYFLNVTFDNPEELQWIELRFDYYGEAVSWRLNLEEDVE